MVKRLFSLLLLFAVVGQCMHGQNLVLNPSFEINSACPSQGGQLSAVNSWYTLTDGTPDYFNTCATNIDYSIPNNAFGTQAASAGDAYSGFVAYGENEVREYLSIPLTTPMVIGQSYCVDFRVSLSDESFFGVQEIGAYFTTNQPNFNTSGTSLNLTPQIFNTDGVIIENDDWVTVSGIITADQAYQHLHIGNFFSNANTTGGGSFPGAPDIVDSYYFLDEVSVQLLSTELLTMNETQQVCAGDQVDFTAQGGTAGTYTWYNANAPGVVLSAQPNLQLSVDNSTTFVVEAMIGSCSVTDSIFVEAVPVPDVGFVLQNGCAGQTAMLLDVSTGVLPGATYEWDVNNDGTIEATTAGEANLVFNTAGNYTVSLTISNNEFCIRELIQNIFIEDDCDPCANPTNFVPNGGFEAFDVCPDDLSGLDTFLGDWFLPTGGTADFFHTCSVVSDPLDFPGVPMNTFGTQTPLEGNGYGGFFAYRADNYREYLSIALSQPMLEGETYCVSFSVNLADDVGFGIQEIGAYLSDNNPSSPGIGPLTVTPQIEYNNGVLLNTNDWVTISQTLTMDAEASFLTIGNFNDEQGTTKAISSTTATLDEIAYYYVDEVFITYLPTLPFEENYQVCLGETFSLAAPEGYCEYEWLMAGNPNEIVSEEAGFSFTPTTTGTTTFVFTGDKGECSNSKTVTVTTETAPITNFAFNAGCFEEVVAFINLTDNTTEGSIYEWDFDGNGSIDLVSNGSVGYFYSAPGTYNATLTVTNPSGCSDSFSQSVVVSPDCDNCDPANLLFNPGFEFYNDCPEELDAITNAFEWFSPTDDQADLFNTCSESGLTGIPFNAYGNVNTFEGDGYAGLVAYVENNDYREYISTQLTTPLVVGQQYCIGFKVHISSGSGFAIDRLGAYFTTNNFIPVNNATPQATNELFDIIFLPGWVEVSAIFTADQPYEYLTLGNFFDVGAELNALDIPNGPANDTAYYYFDNVSLVEVSLEIESDLSPDGLCQGGSATLNAITNLCEHQWTIMGSEIVISNNTQVTVSPNETTTYVYTGSNEACESVTASYTVVVNPSPNLGQDRFLCPEITGVVLNDLSGGAISYTWSPPTDLDDPFSGSPIASPDVTTTYIVQAQYAEPTPCPTTDTVTVFVVQPFAEAGPAIDTVCLGESIQLNASGGGTYEWSPANLLDDPFSATPMATITQNTTFALTVTNADGTCEDVDLIDIHVIECDLGGPEWTEDNGNQPDFLCQTIFRNNDTVIDLPTALDPDLPNDVLTYTLIQPQVGIATLDGNQLNYTPPFNYTGTDTLYVVVCDEAFPVECDTLLICLTIINQPPQFNEESLCLTVYAGTTNGFCFNLTDDVDDLGDLTLTIDELDPAVGSITVNVDNCLVIQTSPTFNGEELFTVTACDPDGDCSEIEIRLLVILANQPPGISIDNQDAVQSFPQSFCFSSSDPNSATFLGENLTYEIVGMPMNGTLTVEDDTCLTYTGNLDFIGTDLITIEVCDDGFSQTELAVYEDLCANFVSFVEASPPLCEQVSISINVADGLVANNDMSNAEDNMPTVFNVLTNDVPTNPETLEIIGGPSNGTINLNSNNTISYIPFTDFLGIDSIIYVICLPPLGCDTATWYINVVNELEAIDDAISTIEDQAFSVDILANDVYPALEPLFVNIIDSTSNGMIVINTDFTVSYFPNQDFFGVDQFIYQICNDSIGCDQAIVTITVLEGVPPILIDDPVTTDLSTEVVVDFLANDMDPIGDTLVVKGFEGGENGTYSFDTTTLLLTYEPSPTFVGSDTIVYTVCNTNGFNESAMIIISVNPPDCDLTVPGGLSPNGDGKNDLLIIPEIVLCEEYRENEITIFNRWGSVVYNRINYGTDSEWWDGSWDNNLEPLPAGTYFYVIETDFDNGGQMFKGAVEVFR